MGAPSPIDPALLADPERLLEQWIVPRLKIALAAQPDLSATQLEVELELGTLGARTLRLKNGALFYEKLPSAKPAIILELDPSDLAELVLGALSPQAALIDGRLQLAGDVGLAMKLAPLLRAVSIEGV